jgi:hypothetical protein
VIDWGRQVAEELLEQRRVRGVKSGSAQRIDLAGCALEALRIATGED